MALQQLDGLATLRLCDARHKRRHSYSGVASDLSPQDFEHLLSKIGSRLVYLEFGLPCVIVDALFMVARHCPLLREFQIRHSPCHLPAPTDNQWPGAMCPELRLLLVRSLGGNRERDSNNTYARYKAGKRPLRFTKCVNLTCALDNVHLILFNGCVFSCRSSSFSWLRTKQVQTD
jgi:hypothetical protein